MFYWFTFADGYTECTRGYNKVEMQHAIHNHGKLIKKVPA